MREGVGRHPLDLSRGGGQADLREERGDEPPWGLQKDLIVGAPAGTDPLDLHRPAVWDDGPEEGHGLLEKLSFVCEDLTDHRHRIAEVFGELQGLS